MPQPAQTHDQPEGRAARLFELGLEERTIEEAVIRGLSARQTCSPFHPPSFPGATQWAETHAALRQILAPAGWTPCDRRNYSRVLSPNERIAITVATGDLRTGDVGLVEPATRYPKGPATRDAVEDNQLSLLPLVPAERDYLTSEPEPIERETSQVLNKIFAALRRDGMNKTAIARELGIHQSDLDAIVFGLAMLPADSVAPLLAWTTSFH